MDPCAAWLTCDEFVARKREALGREPHEGETTHERLLERVASKLGLQVRLEPDDREPLRAPDARIAVVARAGTAFEGSYAQAVTWLMAGAPDAESMAQARTERAALDKLSGSPGVVQAARRL